MLTISYILFWKHNIPDIVLGPKGLKFFFLFFLHFSGEAFHSADMKSSRTVMFLLEDCNPGLDQTIYQALYSVRSTRFIIFFTSNNPGCEKE